jgi:4'-phosphopantetheinyl transferase
MTLTRDRARLYYARTSALADDPLALALLDDEERARHERFMFDHSKREFRAAHALVRCALSRHAPEVDPARWRFVKNAYGRPSIDPSLGVGALRFNLSHTDGMLCLLLTIDREGGADVEDADRPRKTVDVADRFFAPAEVAALRALPEDAQVARFFALWTLKESYIKARGMGLALPLDGFAFAIEPGEDPVGVGVMGDRVTLSCEPVVNDQGDRWAFTRVRLSERHVAAVAIERSGDAPCAIELTEVRALSELRAG